MARIVGRFKTLDFLVRRLKVAPGAAGRQKMAGGGLAWAKEGKGGNWRRWRRGRRFWAHSLRAHEELDSAQLELDWVMGCGLSNYCGGVVYSRLLCVVLVE